MDVLAYLKSLPPDLRTQLYGYHDTVRAIFTALSPVSKCIVLRLLHGKIDVKRDALVSKTENISPYAQLHALGLIRVVETPSPAVSCVALHLDPFFKSQLQATLYDEKRDAEREEAAVPSVSLSDVSAHAQQQWDNVLLTLAAPESVVSPIPPSGSVGPQQRLRHVLLKSGLLDETDAKCTAKGYRFLLSDTSTQVWTLLRQYMDTHASSSADRMSVLNFLLRLHFLTPGKGYRLRRESDPPDTLDKLLVDLHYLGLVYIPSEMSSQVEVYYPTPLATQLLHADSTHPAALSLHATSTLYQREHLIVETNFHLYAYDPTRVTEHLLSLFAVRTYRLPNLIVCRLTRDSALRAFREYGLTAEQILAFLRRNAHVQCWQQLHLRGGTLVPETVAAQLRHWESERNRIRAESGVLYDGFASATMFSAVETYAQQLAVLRYSNPLKRQLVVTESAHEVIKQYIKNISKSDAASDVTMSRT
jgi:transcription initiation factor TFIIH subunit 4